MNKRKNRVLTIVFFAFLVMLFAITAFAEDITIEYYNGSKLDSTIGDNGVQTVPLGTAVTLPTKDVELGKAFVWYTDDGRGYTGGNTVTFEESVKLYQATAVDVDNADDFKTLIKPEGSAIRLIKDITLTSTTSIDWYAHPKLFMNGHTLTIEAGTAFQGQRSGMMFYGSGTINFNGTGNDPIFARMTSHGYRGNENYTKIGRDVTINAQGARFCVDSDGSVSSGYPHVMIYGTVRAKNLMGIDNATVRNPRVEIFQSANVTLTGTVFAHGTAAANEVASLIIHGGTVNFEGTDVSFFSNPKARYTIKGGAIYTAYPSDASGMLDFINQGDYKVEKMTFNNREYTVVIPLGCVNHKYDKVGTKVPSCVSVSSETFKCPTCDHSFTVTYGEKIAHEWKYVDSQEATIDTLGWDRNKCTSCYHDFYEYKGYDPSGLKIIVKVQLPSGVQEIEATLGDVFEIDEPNKVDRVLTKVKAFGAYSLNQIVGVSIPNGISEINITTKNEFVKEVMFLDSSEVLVTSLKSLEALKTIVVNNCIVKFMEGCAFTTLEEIKVESDKAQLNFDTKCFKDNINLSKLNIIKGAKYYFGANSFQNTGFERLDFVDGCSIQFTGSQAFYGCTRLKEIYVGSGVKDLPNKPFECCCALEKVILMEVKSISDNTFSVGDKDPNKDQAELIVYSHSTAEVSFGKNTFANRKEHGIKVYVVSANLTGFDNCNYEMHVGIPHAYTPQEIESTCTSQGASTHLTDCPCGINKSAIYKLYRTGTSEYEVVELLTFRKPKLDHVFSVVSSVEYANGFEGHGIATLKCQSCEEISTDKVNSLPLVTFPGYSAFEGNSASMLVGFRVDSNMLEQYEKSKDTNLKYGIVIAVKSQVKDRILDAAGNLLTKSAVKLPMSELNYYDCTLKLSGLSGTLLDTEFIMTGYIIEKGVVTYLQGDGNTKTPVATTYNQIVSATLPPVQSKEEL